MKRLVLHAPGVHTGGGLVLLGDLLAGSGVLPGFANLDSRVLEKLQIPAGMTVNAVPPSPAARLRAEMALARNTRAEDTVLCFHGMPPLLRVRGKTVVFLQNRNYLGLDPAGSFDGRTRWRLPLERLICRVLKRNADEYIVQSPTMARLTRAWHGGDPRIRVLPYADSFDPTPLPSGAAQDFLYVADGEAHKNHRNLLRAWVLLAAQGVRPSLVLTLDRRFRSLLADIEAERIRHGLQVTNIGVVERMELLRVYSKSRALIFPSTSESFGLPLVEASRIGLPIVAAELDYVRDVCVPAETFDPASPVSIARAVRRFLGLPETPDRIRSSKEFLQELLG